MSFKWDELNYWKSGEWQVIQERFDDRDKAFKLYNPRRELLFAALDATPFDKVKVAIYGQDPYPDRNCCSGIAFDIPNGTIREGFQKPPTLDNLFMEYCDDLHYSYPNSTSLLKWTQQGVLLWNVIPSCEWQKSMSHDWPEWAPLTEEITRRLSDEGDKVFSLMGGVAQRFIKYIKEKDNTIICTSHPVPRASIKSHIPFRGSRIFSHINSALVQDHNGDPIDWKL